MVNYTINFTEPLRSSFVLSPYTSNGNRFPTASTRAATATAASSVLLLHGKGHPDYGERTDENLLHLVENFSGASAPVIDSAGNTNAGILWHREKLYDLTGGNWYEWSIGISTASPSIGGQWSGPKVVMGPAQPAAPVNGTLWYDGSILRRYSDDERGIAQWIQREFSTGHFPGTPPDRELVINHTGLVDDWDALADASSFLRLDTTNDPLTGNLEISKASPTLTLTGTDPVIDMVSATTDPEIRLRGNTNWQVQGRTNVLEIRIGGTSGAQTWFVIDNANGYITHGNNITSAAYASNVVGVSNALANVQYVNNRLVATGATGSFVVSSIDPGSGSPTVDTIPSASSPLQNQSKLENGVLKLAVSSNHPEFPFVNIPNITASEMLFSPSGNIVATDVQSAIQELDTEKASLAGDTFTGPTIFNTTVTVPATEITDPSTAAVSKGYVDNVIAVTTSSTSNISRYVGSASTLIGSPLLSGGSPPNLLELPFKYIAGNNRLLVFVNGSKRYKNDEGYADALIMPPINVSTGLGGLPSYSVLEWVAGSPSYWVLNDPGAIAVGDFSTGDTIRVDNGIGFLSIPYTVANVPTTVNRGSPAVAYTAIPVAPFGGSPIETPGEQLASTVLGIDYDFLLNLDGGGDTPVGTGAVKINGIDASAWSTLILSINNALDSTFGVGLVDCFEWDGNLRFRSLSVAGGSVVVSNGATATTDLFDTDNLGADGFDSFDTPVAATTYSYFEAMAGSPVVPSHVAPYGISTNLIALTDTLTVADIIEVLVI
jgi:hypothetical protein